MSEFRKAPGGGKREQNRQIARLAQKQGGHVSRSELLSLGLGRRAIQSRTESGQLIRVHRGVYAVGHLPTSGRDRARGALLALGPRSALCGKAGAAFWGLYTRWSYPLELVSPLQHRLPTLKTHRCATLIRRDVRTVDGIRVISPARTLLEIAPRTATKTLHRFHNELRMRRLINNELLIDVATRNAQHPGAKHLLKLAGASEGQPKRSPFEVDWPPFARKYGLPEYVINEHVAGERIDVLFTPDRLIIELDGWGSHGTKRAFEEDRDQDSEILAATGIPTMRITHEGFHLRPREQVRRMNAILAQRG